MTSMKNTIPYNFITQILFNMIFLLLTYWMSGLPSEYFRFGLYALVGLIVAFVAEGLGLAIGATFSITVSIPYLNDASFLGNKNTMLVKIIHFLLSSFNIIR